MVLLLALECGNVHVMDRSHGTDLFNDSVRTHEVRYSKGGKKMAGPCNSSSHKMLASPHRGSGSILGDFM
jgi:hypothetical protein